MTILKLNFLFLILVSVVVFSEAHIRGTSQTEDRDLNYYGNKANKYGDGNQGGNWWPYYGYYNPNRRYYNRKRYWQYNKYYQGDDDNANNDDAAADDDGDDQVMEDEIIYYDDVADYNSTLDDNDWMSTMKDYEFQAQKSFSNWYATPPGEWSPSQWAWFSGLMVLFVGISFCTCMCCSNQCSNEGGRKERKTAEYDLDDYTSIGSRGGSFITSNSSGSTEWDDNATYDSIMRLRSD